MWKKTLGLIVSVLIGPAPERDERGLSNSVETVILLAGAVVIAGIIVTIVTSYVTSHLPK